MEEFRDIKHMPTHEISNIGRLRNKNTLRIMKQNSNIDRYHKFRSYSVIFKINNKTTIQYIHRLVALAFIPNPENKPLVDHIDRHPENNHVSNLRWATYKENADNRTLNSNNTSGDSNIYYCKTLNKYKLVFRNYKKDCYKGLYDTFEEAKKAKDTGIYKIGKISNVKEKNITYNKLEKKYIFRKERNKIVYSKPFKTLEEAVIYRDEFLKTL